MSTTSLPHFALVASAGMGHINPMTCLAASLSSYGCEVTFIYAEPTVTLSESVHISKLLSTFPKIRPLVLPLVEFRPSGPAMDPFFQRFEAIIRSAHHLPSLLLGSDRRPNNITALVVDISLAYAYIPIAKQLNASCYIFFISTALMLSACAFFSTSFTSASASAMDIPGIWPIPVSSLPSTLRDPNHQFTQQFVENGRSLHKADGILITTFHALEPEALVALNGGLVAPGLPPTVAIGPLRPFEQKSPDPSSPLPWLDQHPAQSVVYVSFGNRTAMSREQIKELGVGLDRSQCRFLWVLKTKVVDKDEQGGDKELEELLGEGYTERLKGRGLVVNGWVEQEEALAHRAVGGFLNHCGSNSIFEAAAAGVRMLGWASTGDQRVNAEVVRRSGLGIWVEEWGWGEGEVVSGEEIGKKVREMMEDEELKLSAKRLGEEAAKAIGVGGSSTKGLEDFIRNASASASAHG